jgi:hypothetical protein
MATSNQFFFFQDSTILAILFHKNLLYGSHWVFFYVAKWQKFAKIKTLLGSLEYNMEI